MRATTDARLTDPVALPCGETLPNRLAKAAMSEQLGDRANRPTRALERLYARWGAGGCGLLLTGNVMVDRRHVGEPRNVVIEDERDLAGLRAWAAAGQRGGAKVWVQVNHPGRQAMAIAGSRPVAPSPIAPRIPGALTPLELTSGEIEEIVARFARTAAVVQAAGFGGVQLHAAHGYLISQFLSPRANQRTDAWGGDATRRRRFVLEVVRATRAAVGRSFPVSIKLNSADFQRGGFSEEESAEVVAALVDEGIDLIEISGGTYEAPAMVDRARGQRESTRIREAYFLEYAERVRERAGDVPLMVTGGFRSAEAMREAVASGACDVVGVARPLALHPEGAIGVLDGSRLRVDAGTPRLGLGRIDGVVDLYWHTRQIQRVGGGREPQPREPAWLTATAFFAANGWGAFRRRRGG